MVREYKPTEGVLRTNAKICKLRLQGMCTRDIAEKVGCSVTKVRRVIAKNGLPRTSNKERASAIGRGHRRLAKLFGKGGGARTAEVLKKRMLKLRGWSVQDSESADILDVLARIKEGTAEKVASFLSGRRVEAVRSNLYRMRLLGIVVISKRYITERGGRGVTYRVAPASLEIHQRWLYEQKEG